MLINQIKIVRKEESEYPKKLKAIKDCPEVLFAMGNELILNDFLIAVIGSRVCSEYGKDMTKEFVQELVKMGIGIVSGLADGIDTIAHEACIKEGGKTIAVLGEGLENAYKTKGRMIDLIIESGGALISEYFPDQQANQITFPRRNRIISGISDGVLVTEARENSGAFITTQFARKQGKKIFAIPTNITNLCGKGNNKILLKQKAKMVIQIEDILCEYTKELKGKKRCVIKEEPKPIPFEYEEVWNCLSFEFMDVNQLCRRLNKSVASISSLLTIMEMQGWIEQKNGQYFRRKK